MKAGRSKDNGDFDEHNVRYKKNDAYYKGKKLVGCVFDPSGVKKPDGSLDKEALVDEIMKWFQTTTKKIDDTKNAEADAKEYEK